MISVGTQTVLRQRRAHAALMIIVAASAVLTTLVSHPTAPLAYERTKTCGTFGSPSCEPGQTPKPLAWPMRDLTYTIQRDSSLQFPAGSGSDNSTPFPPNLESLLTDSFKTWEDPADCSELSFNFEGYTSKDIAANRGGVSNNTNVLVWRSSGWEEESSILALTYASFTSDGRIVDGDIEVNAEDFNFDDLASPQPNGGTADVRNTMVHEAGHFIGLAHSEELEATMYRSATVGETKKRNLHPDDIAGLCAAYPPCASNPDAAGCGQDTCASNPDAPGCGQDNDRDGGCGGCRSLGNPENLPGSALLTALTLLAVSCLRRLRWRNGA